MNKLMDGLRRLFSKDKSMGLAATALLIAVVVVLNIVIFNVTSAFGLYIYSPEMTDLRISGNTDTLFAKSSQGKSVTVVFCMPEDDLKNHSTGSYVWQTVRQFEERYDFIDVKYVNMLTKRDEKGEIFSLGKFTTDMRGNETKILTNSVIFYEGEGESYRVVTDSYSSAGFADFFALDSHGSAYAYVGEEVVASMISWVMQDEHPTVYMTEKHGETADISFGNMLTCAGYYVELINLREREVPSDAEIVIISNPTTDFYRLKDDTSGRSEIERLNAYLERGGSIYVALDPLSRHLPVLEGFLAERGITVSGITAEDGSTIRSLVRDNSNSVTTDGYSFVVDFADSPASSRIKTILSSYTDARVLISSVAGLEIDATLGAQPLLSASDNSSLVAEGRVVDSEGGYAIAGFSERRNDDGSYGRVVVIPTIYMTARDALVSENYSNGDYLYALFSAFFGATSAPIGCRSVTYGTPMLEGFTMSTAHLFTILVIAIPVALAMIGTVVIIKRKNR